MTGIDVVRTWRPSSDGLRRFDPGRDLRDVIQLLQLGFGADLDPRDQRWLNDLQSMSGAGPLLGWVLKVVPAAENVFSGFVWQANGQVVANASLMRATQHVWVIANVVTHPDWRRRGLARQLVEAAIDSARAHGARQVQLQVREDNAGALAMYGQMGFNDLFTTTLLRLDGRERLRPLAPVEGETRIVPWSRGSGAWVEDVLARAGRMEGPPPGVIRQTLQRQGLAASVGDRLRGVRRYAYAARAELRYGAVGAAMANAMSGAHSLEVATDPAWRGRVEELLVAQLLDKLARHRPLEVEAEVRDAEAGVRAALAAAGFDPVRTLVRMRLPL